MEVWFAEADPYLEICDRPWSAESTVDKSFVVSELSLTSPFFQILCLVTVIYTSTVTLAG